MNCAIRQSGKVLYIGPEKPQWGEVNKVYVKYFGNEVNFGLEILEQHLQKNCTKFAEKAHKIRGGGLHVHIRS